MFPHTHSPLHFFRAQTLTLSCRSSNGWRTSRTGWTHSTARLAAMAAAVVAVITRAQQTNQLVVVLISLRRLLPLVRACVCVKTFILLFTLLRRRHSDSRCILYCARGFVSFNNLIASSAFIGLLFAEVVLYLLPYIISHLLTHPHTHAQWMLLLLQFKEI